MMLAVLALAVSAVSAAPKLDLSVASDGSFTIEYNGKTWLAGSEYAVDDASASAGSLKLQGPPSTGSGSDKFGQYTSTTTKWAKSGSTDTLMEASFRVYADDAAMIVFEQSFPNGVTDEPVSVGIAPPSNNFDGCRVAADSNANLVASANGYDAYVVKDGQTTEHKGYYCDDNHKYAYHGDVNLTECAAECAKSKCTCYDFHVGGPAPSPSPSPHGGSGSASRTLFPGFKRNSGPADSLATFSYHGVFPSMHCASVAKYEQSHQGGAPLVIYDDSASSGPQPMVVFSPLNYPKAHHMTSSPDFFGAGVKDTVTTIPAGWSQMFLLSAGEGINAGMLSWGDRMLKFTGKARADKYLDDTHGKIGFWTDNGGYYHYSTGLNKSATYEEVLPKVKAYHDSIGIPFGHWQFDSWFYPKDGPVNGGGGGGAVVNWTAMPSVFPHGMAYIQSKLQLPTVMHNRQWSDHSDYIHNWTDITWYESKFAIPHDPIKFFTRFFTQQEGWGLSMYEQDWMCTEYDGVDALQENITMGDLWLLGMATGAASSNRTVQFCMPYPNDLLSASALPAVSNARATGDYFHSMNQWAVGHTSLFYWAIGILPFKDGFYSSNNKQVGGQTVGPETNPDRETLMATLSTAMVGPMDGIYLLNKSRIMQTCRGDGLVLKPDVPVAASDECFRSSVSDPAHCYVYTTYSDIKGLGRVAYLFLNDATYPITAAAAHLSSASGYAFFNFYTGEIQDATKAVGSAATAGYENHVYAVFTPVVGGWAFVGEKDKYVTVSSVRFPSVTAQGASGLTAQVVGSANETVSVCAASNSDWKLVCKSLDFPTASTKTVSFP